MGTRNKLAQRIAGYLALVLIGGAIILIFKALSGSSSSNDTKTNGQEEISDSSDLSLISDFEV